jgi:outer membrane autotransporter protein
MWTEYNGDHHVEANGTLVEGTTEDIATRFGVRTYGQFSAGVMEVLPYVAIDWRHGDLGGDQMTFDGVRVSGPMPEERYELRAGTQLAFANGWNVWGNLSLQEGDGSDFHQFGGQVNVGYRW